MHPAHGGGMGHRQAALGHHPHHCRWLPEPAQIRRHVKLKAYHRPPRLARLVGGQLRAEWLRGTPAGAAAEGG